MTNKFVVFEGMGGSGKSTQIKLASKYLTSQKIRHIVTREPGGSPEAELIRELIFTLGRENLLNSDYAIALYSAARTLWLNQIVRPALAKGQSVISDRTYFTTAAFQGYGQGADLDEIKKVTSIVMGETKPNAVILIDISVESSLSRLGKRGEHGGDPFDEKERSFLEKVEYGYKTMAQENWGDVPWFVVKGEESVKQVESSIQKCLNKIFDL